MKRFKGLSVFLIWFLFCSPAFAQIPRVLASNPLYSHQKDIINGVKWNYEMKYRGSPFLSPVYWPRADIRFHGKNFTGVRMNYDLFTDRLIVFVPEKGNEKYVVPAKEYLEGFSWVDSLTGMLRHFEYLNPPGTPHKDLYEVAFRDSFCSYLIKHQVGTRSRIGNGYLGDYVRRINMYVRIGSRFGTFRNKRTLLKFLGSHIPELRKFIRDKGLKINRDHYLEATPVIRRYEELEKGSS